jgi:hypothetical protein
MNLPLFSFLAGTRSVHPSLFTASLPLGFHRAARDPRGLKGLGPVTSHYSPVTSFIPAPSA